MEKPPTPILATVFTILAFFCVVVAVLSAASSITLAVSCVINATLLLGFSQAIRYLSECAFFARRMYEVSFKQEVSRLASDPTSIDQAEKVEAYNPDEDEAKQTPLWVYILISLLIVGIVIYFIAPKA